MNKRQKILIADDAKFNRDILKEFLGETYDYLEAENGNQAVQIMEENLGINLMLLDINMRKNNCNDRQCFCRRCTKMFRCRNERTFS